MANLGQFEDNNKFKDVDAFINSPLPKLGEVNLSPKATSGYSETSRPRLATNKVDYSAYADKPWYEDVAAVGKSIGAGAAVDLPEMVGRAAQAFSTEDSAVSKWGKSVVQSAKDRAKEWEVDMRGRGDVAKAFIEGGRMLAPSLAALPAYLAGPAVGTTATLALYGGSQYQDVYDRAKANGLSDDQAHRAGLLSGAIEGGGEAIANKFSLGMLGVGKKVFGKGMEGAVKGVTGGAEESIAKPFLKEYGKAMVGENITEGLQQYGEGKVEEGFGFGKETTLAGSFGETLGPTSAMTTLLAPLGIAGHYRNAKDAKNANSRAEAINLILDNPSSATPEERMRVVDMIHDHAISLKIPEEEANAWKADALESIKTNAPINRYAESLGSKKDAIVSEKDSLPTGDKLTNKDIGKVYSKFSDVFDKAQDPSDPAYQESYNNIISSLDSIITPKEGKDQDKIKVEEATRTKEYIQAVHDRFVKDYNTKNDIDKSQEEIIQSQKESDESKVAETVSEQEELNSLISSSEEKVREVEETIKTSSKPAKVKVDEVLDTLNRPIDESVGISQEVSDIMDEVVTSEDLVDIPVDEEVEPTVSKAVDEPVEAPTPSPIQPEGQVTAKPPRISLKELKESLGIKELPPEQKVSTMEKYSDPVKNLSATLKILENLPEDKKQNYLVTIDSIKKQIKDLQDSKVEEKPKGVLEIPDASITQTVHYELEKAFSEGNRLPVKLKDGSEIYLVNVKDPKGQSKIAAFDRDGVRIGGLSYSSDPNYAEEVSVNVDKDWRRKGVATLLYDTAEKLGGNIPPFDSKNVFRSHEGQVFRESRELSKQGKPRSSEESNKAFIESKIKEYKSKIEADKYDIQHIKENPNDYLDADLQFAEERLQETLKEYNNFLKESNTLISNKRVHTVKQETKKTTKTPKTPNTPKVTKEPVENYKSGDKIVLNKYAIHTKGPNAVEPKFLKDDIVIAEYAGPAGSPKYSFVKFTYINNGIDANGNPTQKPETKTFKISNRAILKKVGESTSLAEDIKTESVANEEVVVKAVVTSEEPVNNLSADDIEESKEEIKISPKTSVTVDSLTDLYFSLLYDKKMAFDSEDRAEIQSEINRVVTQLKDLGYTINKDGITKINKKVDDLEVTEESEGAVDFPSIEVHDIDDFGRINFSDETGDYQESTNTSRYDPRTQSEKDRRKAINTNRLVFNKLIEMIDPKATFSSSPGKAVYDTPDVTYILIDDFYEYSQERFEKEEGFSPRASRSVHSTNGLFYHPVNQKPRIYMNGRTPSKIKFIETFIHETVGHYGLRRLLEGKGHKYKNFLLHLINSNSEIRKAVLNKYEGWVHYNDNYIKEWVGKGYDYTPTDKEVRAFFDNLVEGKEYVTAKVKYGDSEKVVKIPMDVALRYADEYLADLAKELYFDQQFSEEYLGKGVKDSPSRISRRIRMNKMFNMILAKIKHLLRSVFGDYMDHLTIDDVKVMIAASHDNLFHTIDQDALLAVEYKEPHKPRNPILHLKKGGTTTVSNEGEEIAHSVGAGTIDSEGLAEEPAEVTKKKIEGLVGRPDEFKALQSSGFGNLKGRFLEKQYKALSDKMGSGIFKGLTTFKTMNNVEMYRALNTWFLGNVAKAEKYMKEMEVVFKDVEPIQLKAAYSYFTTKGAELDPRVFPKESVRIKLEEYKTKIEELGKELVDAGLLDPEIYEENKGMYLHTVYLDFIRDYKGSGKKASIMSWYRKRKKLSEREKFARGQIKDVKYLVPETIGVIMRDTALIQMFNAINTSSIEAKTYWVLTSDTKIKLPWDNRKTVTIDRAYELMSDIEDIIDGAEGSAEISAQLGIEKNNINKLKSDLQTIADRVRVVEDKLLEDAYNQHVIDKSSTDKESFIKNNYIRAPKDRRWGDLGGKLIRKEIYDDLEMVTASYRLDQMSSEVEKFFAPGGLLERINRFWKKTMVMYNPGSWGRNAVGNFSLLDLSTPTSSIKLMDMLWNELDTYRKSKNGEGSKYWQLANQHGLFGTSYSAVELLDYYNKYADKFQEALDRHSKTPKSSWSQYFPFLDERFIGIINLGKDLALDKYHRFDNTLSKHYSLLEGIFKTVAFRDYIQRYEAQEGISYESLSKDEQEMLFLKATNHANEAIFNYSEVPGIVKFLRRTPMGSPFLTFTYKAAPLMVKSMMTNPVKFAKYATLPAALTMIAQAVNDWDDDDIKKFRSRLPEYYRNNPGVAFFPFKDSEGRPQILPMDYMIPWNQVWTAASKSYANYMKTGGEGVVGPTVSSAGTFIDEFGFLGGPFPKMITAYKTGKDDFTGRDIVTAGASPNQQLLEQMAYASNMFLPAWLANGGYFSKLYDTFYKEKKNEFGELAMTPLQAVSDITGFRTRSVLEQGGLNARQKEFQSRLREVSTLRNRIIKDRNIDPMDKISKMKDIALREKMIREQMRKAIAGTE